MLISEAVYLHVRLQEEYVLEEKSAAWLVENTEVWKKETAAVLSKRYRMRVSY